MYIENVVEREKICSHVSHTRASVFPPYQTTIIVLIAKFVVLMIEPGLSLDLPQLLVSLPGSA